MLGKLKEESKRRHKVHYRMFFLKNTGLTSPNTVFFKKYIFYCTLCGLSDSKILFSRQQINKI